MNGLESLQERHSASLRAGKTESGKSFPAMVLTPEIRDKILKAGVPIWALAGMTTAELMNLGANQDEQGFADGGKVSTIIDALKRFAPKKDWNDKLRAEKGEFQKISGGSRATLDSLRAALENNARKNAEDDAKMAELRANSEWIPPENKADGGVARLKSIAENVGTEDTVDRRKRILSGLASQWFGVNPDSGEVEFLGGWSPFPKVRSIDEYRERTKQAAEGTLHDAGPGLLDEVQSMLFGTKGADAADERLLELKRRIRGDMGIGESHGFQENFDEGLGTMLGQLPVPLKGSSAAGKVPLMERLKNLAKTLPEWFTPTVDPKMANYLTGATVGGGIGALADMGEDSERGQREADNFLTNWNQNHPDETHMAEGGPVKTPGPMKDMMSLLRNRLDELSTGLPSVSDPGDNAGSGFEELQMKAKGGKITNIMEAASKLVKPKEVEAPPLAPMSFRVQIPREMHTPEFLNSAEFESLVKQQLQEALHDSWLDREMASQFQLDPNAPLEEADFKEIGNAWRKALTGQDIGPAPKSDSDTVSLNVPLQGPEDLVGRLIGGGVDDAE